MLDKLKFNNLVITNKNHIQRGRVQTINKVVQKLRKIKELLAKQPGDQKLKERQQKCVANIEQLKKLKQVEIIKMILLLDKKPTSILTNSRSTPEEVIIALLAQNKIISKLIDHFKKELVLADIDKEWRDQLMQTTKRRMKINRTEQKRQKRKDLKLQKSTARQRLDWLEKNKPEKTDDEDISPPKVCEPVATEVLPTKENVTKEVKKEKPIASRNLSLQKNRQKSSTIKNVEKQKIGDTSKMDKKDPQPVEPAITHVVDPFFITEQGENYLSTAVINQPNLLNDNDSQENRQPNEFKSRRDFKRQREETKVFKGKFQDESFNDLHPSWAAKLKQKVSILPSKVNKIYFDDDNNTKEIVLSEHKAIDKAQTDTDVEKLHPSWIAKQKMKPNISLFQGKKIKFDDDS